MKYKVGDKVKIREDLIVNEIYGCEAFVENMKAYLGKQVTIAKESPSHVEYYIEEDSERWRWTDEMFEDYIEDTKKESKIHSTVRTVDVGFHFDYCGHKVLEDVLQGETGKIRHYYTKDYEIQYIIPIENVDFIIPHED